MEQRDRILVVDDEPRMRESLQSLLSHHGYKVATAATGRQALQALGTGGFDLVLLDVMLPDLDGHGVLAHIRQNSPDVLVIMISGFASIEAAVAALKNGAFDFIRKPAEHEELIKRVDNALDRRRLIREKERVARELERTQRRYRYLVESSPDIIYVLDEGGRFTFVNDAFEKLLGIQRDQVLGHHYSEFVEPEDLTRSVFVFNERRTGQRATTGVELRLRRHESRVPGNGSSSGDVEVPLPVEINAHGIYEQEPEQPEKKFLGTYGVARDIRERKLLEEHLQQEEKMEAVGRLAGGIAHDFNNFLAAIVGNVALAKIHTKDEQEVLRRLSEMERAALRARELTQQLITFARGGAPVKQAGTLPELIRDAAVFVLRGSNVRSRFDFAAELWLAEFDAGQIIQVIQNLVINADQAMPDGGNIEILGENVTVTEAYHLPLKPGRYVRITIRDEGCGIPKDNLPKIFDPFFTTKSGGMGFGLSTAYSILKNHGGYLDVDSEEGRGTRFFFFLPAVDGPSETAREPKRRTYAGRGRILVMDDDPRIREVYKSLLNHLGYSAVVVSRGEEALAAYKKARDAGKGFDAVIMDLTIPGAMGGKEAVKRLLEMDPDAVAIISSGYSNDPVMANYKRYGFREVIAKPFTSERLSEALWNALKARKR
jgi:two-component system cell cycle sensor histidine kinase/response regulator CckA